jgi:hypothetical protein
MNQIIKQNLREELVRTINSFNPEYIEQSEECDTYLSGLIDSIERFEEECNTELVEKIDREGWFYGKH